MGGGGAKSRTQYIPAFTALPATHHLHLALTPSLPHTSVSAATFPLRFLCLLLFIFILLISILVLDVGFYFSVLQALTLSLHTGVAVQAPQAFPFTVPGDGTGTRHTHAFASFPNFSDTGLDHACISQDACWTLSAHAWHGTF